MASGVILCGRFVIFGPLAGDFCRPGGFFVGEGRGPGGRVPVLYAMAYAYAFRVCVRVRVGVGNPPLAFRFKNPRSKGRAASVKGCRMISARVSVSRIFFIERGV